MALTDLLLHQLFKYNLFFNILVSASAVDTYKNNVYFKTVLTNSVIQIVTMNDYVISIN